MRWRVAAAAMLAAAGLAPATARAADAPADAPLIAPAPAWVRPVALPAAPAKPDDAPVRLVLVDQQVRFADGVQTTYSEIALRIQTPQGLAAGNVSLPWRPDSDVLTVHKLLIRRGDQVIDVLASGQTFTVVRRETNLESATLDGVLTANIQPEGLQVGDVLDFAASVRSSDPTLKGHVEAIGATWNGAPIARAHLRATWPTTLAVRLRQSGALPALKPVKTGGTTSVEVSLDDLQPVPPPKGAPARYRLGRLVELTDYASWTDLAALMAPLYAKAATLPAAGPLQAEVARIRAASPDPKRRAEAALALVQDRVRYVALALGTGNLVPADAAATWARRYGDCKGKTALLLALLHALDIPAEPVLVSSVFGDGLDERLPMAGLFNHVLVRATVAGATYWLDGTRTGDTALDRLKVPGFGWGLPVVPAGAALVRMLPPPLDRPGQEVAIRIDATAGLAQPAPFHVETVLRGDEAIGTSLGLANLAGEARDRALRDYWKGQYDFVDVIKVDAAFDSRTGEQRLTMDGTARMDWRQDRYETDGTGVGWKADFARDAGPGRDAPFAVPYPYYSRTVETVLLPRGQSGFAATSGTEVDRTVAGIEYRRHAKIAGNVFTIEKTERSIAPEFSAKDAPAAQTALRALADASAQIVKPAAYWATEREIAASTPTTAKQFVSRGAALLERSRYDEAIADFDRALALDPKDAWALANRALARLWKGDDAAAAKDLAAAAAVAPRNPVMLRARGLLAQRKGDFRAAIDAYDASLAAEPDNMFALIHRAQSYRAAGDDEHALADAAAGIKAQPATVDLYLLRANILRAQGKREAALAEAAALTAANPQDGYAQVVAARVYAACHMQAEAMRAYDRAIAIEPAAYIYVNRSYSRERGDVAGRRADVDAALRLDPKSGAAIAAKAALQSDGGDYAGAAATYTAALAATPDDRGMLAARGVAYARAGRTALADKDFAAVRGKNADANTLNGLCWEKATAGVALESALGDCDAALAKAPETPAYLDSRALVLLRLGRIDDAIADYGRALAKAPRQSASLYGRAVAWARKGDKAKSDADAAAATKIDPDVADGFARFDVRR